MAYGPSRGSTVAELDSPVQLFSWRKLEELEVMSYDMHHGMIRRIQWPSANPATVPGLGSRFLCTWLAFLNQCGLAVWLGGVFFVDSLLSIFYLARKSFHPSSKRNIPPPLRLAT